MKNATRRDALRHRRGGFTLVEVVVAAVLMGLFAMIAMPRINFTRVRVDSAAIQITSQLLLAQRIAVMRQYDVRVAFDSVKYQMVIHQDKDNDGVVDSDEQTRRESIGEGVQFASVGTVAFGPGSPVTFEIDPLTNYRTLVFHRNGSASEEGAVHITNRPAIGKNDDRVIRLTRATGLAKCWNRRTLTAWTEGC